MTSLTVCPVCCGEFPVYFACGRVEGHCPQCGYAYQDTKADSSYDEEAEQRKERDRQALADAARMSFAKFCDLHQPGEWPWFRVVVDDKALGSFLTLEDAVYGGYALLPVYSTFRIVRQGILVKVVTVKPESKRHLVHVQYAIPRFPRDEDGDWYSYDFATPTFEEAQRVIQNHKALGGIYFKGVIA